MSSPLLSNQTLGQVNPEVEMPGYDRASIRAGIVHLGIGAFHRAHQAVFTDDCLRDGECDWGIIGASLRSAALRDALRKQDYLYTLSVRDADRQHLRVIGLLCDVLVAPENPDLLFETMSRPEVRIVSLTVTEKAYLRNAKGDLDYDHPDIVADLASPLHPRTLFGFIVGAVERRREIGIAPFTVLSCDNLAANGRTLHRLLIQFAARRSDDLATFIRENLACPSTMVDRIVPATTPADCAQVSALLGLQDGWPVTCEPFAQWIVEDHFPLGRPGWERHGAVFVNTVEPFELMKLRLLNGAHSAIAYLGQLLGHETVAEAFSDHRIVNFVRGLWDELITTLPVDAGLDPRTYVKELERRFSNTALKHRTAQIANDGSQKLPQRIVAAAIERLGRGETIERMAFVTAAWIAALTRRQPNSLDFTDALDVRLGNVDPAAIDLDHVFEIAGFASDDPHRTLYKDRVSEHLAHIQANGVAAALDALNGKA